MSQTSVRYNFNEFEPYHYERLVEIYNSIYPERPRTVEEWKFNDQSLDRKRYHFKRYACMNTETGVILGFGEIWHAPWMFHPRKFQLDGWVDLKHQGEGVGSAIYDMLNRDLEDLDATVAWVYAREDLVRSVKFVTKRGFKEKLRGWESVIDPSEVDLSRFDEYSERVLKAGIQFTTLAEEQRNNPGNYQKLHELVQTAFRDVPIPGTPTDTPFDQWYDFEIKSPNLLPEGYVIAKDGDRYVGLSVVWGMKKDPQSLYQGLTGVLRDYRGKGIAVALKLRVLDFARRNDYREIRTFNASTNEAMLDINMKLGFKRDKGWITFEKNLPREGNH